MKSSGDSIVFFGSGPVAAKSLELLYENFRIETVVTKPKPEHHRGDFPVLKVSSRLNLPVLTPKNKKELTELIENSSFQSRLGVVIDYGIIIEQAVIDYFPLGIINSHFSLLPQWRGADPISFAVLSGQRTTGVSLMLITAGLDEGPLLAQATFDMSPTITTPRLTDELIALSNSMLAEILPEYIAGTIDAVPQELATMAGTTNPTYSRKLTKEDGIIDWQKPAAEIEREIRAFIDWPKSRTRLAGKDVVITGAHTVDRNGTSGSLEIDGKQILVFCGDGALAIDNLKPAGKKEMTSEAFLAGHRHLF